MKRRSFEDVKGYLIFGGSAILFGLGTYLIVKDAKFVIAMKKAWPDLERSFKGFDKLKDLDIVKGFVTVEYVDGTIGILDLQEFVTGVVKNVANI